MAPKAGKQEKALIPDDVTGVTGGVAEEGWRKLGSLPTDEVQTEPKQLSSFEE